MSSTTNIATSISPSRIGFEDLPPEVRNIIYAEAFHLDCVTPQKQQFGRPLPLRNESLLRGVYNPYLTWTGPTANSDRSELLRSKWTYSAGAVFLKEPIVWQLNRRIRSEAMPFYLRDHLSVEIRGHDGSYSSSPTQLGLKHFKRWWNTLDSHIVRIIRTAEVRDFVDIIYPEAKHEADPITGEGLGVSWPCELAALSIRISEEGRTITVSSPLRMVESQTRYMQEYLNRVAEDKKRGPTSFLFDGEDIFNFICWLRTDTEREPWQASTVEVGDDDLSVNFTMWGDETVTYLEKSPWFVVPKTWLYIAASVSLAS